MLYRQRLKTDVNMLSSHARGAKQKPHTPNQDMEQEVQEQWKLVDLKAYACNAQSIAMGPCNRTCLAAILLADACAKGLLDILCLCLHKRLRPALQTLIAMLCFPQSGCLSVAGRVHAGACCIASAGNYPHSLRDREQHSVVISCLAQQNQNILCCRLSPLWQQHG